VAEPGEHPADLAVFPFGEDHLHDGRQPLVADDPHALGANFSLGEPDPLGQLVENFPPGFSGDDDSIDLLDAEFRMRELIGEFPVVGQ